MTSYQCRRQTCDTCHTERDKYAWFGYRGSATCELCMSKLRRMAERAEKARERWRLKKQRQRANGAALRGSAHEASLARAQASRERTLAIFRADSGDESALPWDEDDSDLY